MITGALVNLSSFFSSLLQPARKESVVEWIEANIDIPTGAVTGKASLRHTPYAREIMERFGDKKTRHLVLCFGTQSGKTSCMIWGMLYRLCRDAQDAMWVLPNGELAKSFSKSRWQKYVRNCKLAMNMVPRTARGEVDKHLWGFMEQHFLPMVLNFVGSNSPANLASRPVGLLVLDECDKFGDESKFEAAAIQLAEERTKTYPFPLVVKASTPTLANRMIWQEFLKSDRRFYWLKCPRCEEEILLKMSIQSAEHGDCGLRWWREDESESKTNGAWDMSKVASNAYYKCQSCGGEIQEGERPMMLENGIWKPDMPNAEPGRHGYQLSSLYSILSNKTSFPAVAVQWLTAKGMRRDMQNFINSWLAEPWDESRGYEHKVIKTENYTNEDISKEVSTPIMAIDCQDNHYWVVVRRFAAPTPGHPHGQSWLLYADRVETEDELKEIQKDYGVLGENVTADMAHRPNQVGRMIIENDWRGIWGTDTKEFYHPQPNGVRVSRPYSVVQFRDPMLGTQWESRTFKRARYVKFAKSVMMDVLSSMRYSDPTIWHITANVSPRYTRQINSRVKEQRSNLKTGRVEWFWKELHQENHLLDSEVHVTVRALQLGLLSLPNESEEQNV